MSNVVGHFFYDKNGGAINPSFAYYWRGIGESGLGENTAAIHDEKTAIEKDFHNASGAYVALGSIYDSMGETTDALEQANLAIKYDPKNPWGYNLRGLIQSKLGNKTSAINDLKYAIDLSPEEPIFKKNLEVIQTR